MPFNCNSSGIKPRSFCVRALGDSASATSPATSFALGHPDVRLAVPTSYDLVDAGHFSSILSAKRWTRQLRYHSRMWRRVAYIFAGVFLIGNAIYITQHMIRGGAHLMLAGVSPALLAALVLGLLLILRSVKKEPEQETPDKDPP